MTSPTIQETGMKVDELVTLPWTALGPVADSQAGEKFYKLTISELPGFMVTGSTPYEVISNVRSKLHAFLTERVENGEFIPLPVKNRKSIPVSAK